MCISSLFPAALNFFLFLRSSSRWCRRENDDGTVADAATADAATADAAISDAATVGVDVVTSDTGACGCCFRSSSAFESKCCVFSALCLIALTSALLALSSSLFAFISSFKAFNALP